MKILPGYELIAKIETVEPLFPNTLFTLSYKYEPWENSEYVPILMSHSTIKDEFLFPVKLLKRPKDWFLSRSVVAVRTDVYPLWWVYVWLYLQTENLFYLVWCYFMRLCNQLGIAKTPPECMYSRQDLLWWRHKRSNRKPIL